MSIPTASEEYIKLMENLRKGEESAYMLAHLTRAQGSKKDHAVADGWIAVGELMKRMLFQITQLAQGKLN